MAHAHQRRGVILLKAWNTGHPGGLATLHANGAAEGLSRLEDLIGEVTQRIPHRAIGPGH